MNQSTRHIMMMEPIGFQSNIETMETNTYQHPNPENVQAIQAKAVLEMRGLRDTLVEHGVFVTTLQGQKQSPDDIFCNNWVATFLNNAGVAECVYYPMLAPNRQIERRPEILKLFEGRYKLALDLSEYERAGKFLESTGSHWCDRVNKIAYAGLSARTNKEVLKIWADKMGYALEIFETKNHKGVPVYHTDVMMFIGTGYAAICMDCILPEYQSNVRARLSKTHEIIELSMPQLQNFCGNALEVRGVDNKKFLTLSSGAFNALTKTQRDTFEKYIDGFIFSDLTTIETYGGGSARCMMLELW